MNQVRAQLSTGLSPSEIEAVQRMVAATVAQVDAICREHGSTPGELPTPSRRAYEYLKGLDFDNVDVAVSQPRSSEAGTKSKRQQGGQRQIRVKNLISLCNWFHKTFARLVREDRLRSGCSDKGMRPDETVFKRRVWRTSDPDIAKLSKHLRAEVDKVDVLCQDVGARPSELPVRSKRAYQWLRFLCRPEHLVAHLTTLAEAMRLTQRRPPPREGMKGGMLSDLRQQMPRQMPRELRELPVRVEFYFTSTLYSTRVRKGQIRIVAHEAFIGAPHSVIRSLMWTALATDATEHADEHAARVKAYAAGDAFADVLLELELDEEATGVAANTQGQYFDLAKIFERVNAEYFDGTMACPRLTWNRTITHRKFGHYQPTTDTLMISITLDQAEVPAYAIEFVMYHELLHKHLGVDVINGRRYAHTTAFRTKERAFQHYEQAQAFLAQLSHAVRSGR